MIRRSVKRDTNFLIDYLAMNLYYLTYIPEYLLPVTITTYLLPTYLPTITNNAILYI